MQSNEVPSSPRKHGYTEGAPGGTAPTSIRADHLNCFQEEICNAVEGAGITLEKTDSTQLLKSIRMQCAKSAFQLEIADDTAAASNSLTAIARRPRTTSDYDRFLVVGEDGDVFESDGGEFTQVTPGSGFAGDFWDVTYDANLGLFLLCGADGEIQSCTSTGAGTATRRSTGGTADLLAIASSGTGLAVAVGQAGLIKYTSNGTAWSTGTDPSGGDNLNDVAFGAGLFVMLANDKIYSSPTGQTWALRASPLEQRSLPKLTQP